MFTHAPGHPEQRAAARRARSKDQAGFTLVEIMMALMIVATSIAALMIVSTRSLNRAGDTNFLRVAKMLLRAKMGEIIAGTETNDSGSFDDQGFVGYRWEKAQVELMAGDAEKVIQITVGVHHPSMASDDEIQQSGLGTDATVDGPNIVRATTYIDPPDAKLVPAAQAGSGAQTGTTGTTGR